MTSVARSPRANDGGKKYYAVLSGMSDSKPYARISITLPEQDLAAADALAASLDRPRSWVIAEAIRRYAAGAGTPHHADDLGVARRTQLLRDLALTPEQRVHEADATARLAEQVQEPRRYPSFDDFRAARLANRDRAL